MARLRAALLNVVTPELLASMVRALLKRAEHGDIAAAKLILAYTLGKPLTEAENDQLDRQRAHDEMFGVPGL